MTLSNLKKGSSLDKLKKAVEASSAGGAKSNVDERLWQPEVDAAGNGYAVVRFLDTPAVDGEDEDGESDRRILNRSATQKWGDVRPERLRATRRWRASPARTGKPAAWRRAAVGALCARAVTARRRTAGRVVADRTLESQERR